MEPEWETTWKKHALLALCHVVKENWNCRKEGDGLYLLTDEYDRDTSLLKGDYLGHNIACMAFFQETESSFPIPIAFALEELVNMW